MSALAGPGTRYMPPGPVPPPLPAVDRAGPSARARLGAFLTKLVTPRPVILETMRPVEIPVITETKRRWSSGDRAGSVGYAYGAVLYDLQRAFSVEFRPDWTNEEILVFGVTPEMVPIPDFLARLVRMYEPIRYGGAIPDDAGSPEPLLQSIYAHHAMWRLYVEAVPHRGAAPAPVAAPASRGEAAP